MTDATYVNEAAGWAQRLTHSEARGPGDMRNAWQRLEARYGIPWRTFWALRYRKPNEIATSIYAQLQAAYRAECERQMRRLQHEIHITEQIAGADHPAVAQAKALIGTVGRRAPSEAGPAAITAAPTEDNLEIPAFLVRTK